MSLIPIWRHLGCLVSGLQGCRIWRRRRVTRPVSPAPGVRVGVLDSASRGSPTGNVRSSVGKRPKVESGVRQASRTPVSPPPGRREYINIGACQDELDPSVVEKLPPAVALAATLVHKYWTSPFGKAVDTAEVTELNEASRNVYLSQSYLKL
ncbi:hypothetical protein Fot_33965 [Forsythia ovata]|uniref:Uncharacterized protein n=1 Tax=Forsythia ovata TaxID=205694 RepID=A0ABD1TCN4_9LAMI